MVLIPLLTAVTDIKDSALFSTSLCIMLPVCIVSICVSALGSELPLDVSLPYLISGAIGGMLAGILGKKVSVKWLHRGLGIMILWGGVRYLC